MELPRAEAVKIGDGDRRMLLGILFGCICLCSSIPATVAVLAPALKALFGLGSRQLGIVLSSASVGGLISIPLVTVLGDRLGHRRMLSGVLVGASASCLVCGYATGMATLAGGLVLTSVFGAAIFPLVATVSLHLFPRHRRRMFTLTLVASSLAGVFWPAAAQAWIEVAAGSRALLLRAPFSALALLFLMLAGLSVARRYPRFRALPVARGGGSGCTAERSGHNRALVLVLLLVGLHSSADTALYNWMPTYLDGLSGAAGTARLLRPGMVLSAYSIAYLASRLLLSFLPENVWRRRLLVVPGLVGGGIATLAILSRSYDAVVWGYLAAAFLFSFEYPNIVARGSELMGERLGLLMGLTSVMGTIGGAAGTFAVGWAAKAWELPWAMAAGALQFVCVGALGIVLGRSIPPPSAAEAAGAHGPLLEAEKGTTEP